MEHIAMDRQELELVIVGWANKYSARIDHDLNNGWPDLELRLRDLVDEMSLKELTLGPGSDFQDNRLDPMIQSWTDRHVTPILEDAEKELRKIYESIQVLHVDSHVVPGEWKGMLSFGDLTGPGAVAAGAGVGVAAVVIGISKATSWIIFTVIVVNWYLVIAGVVLGVILIALGAHGMLGLKAKLRDRFREALVPKIKEVILGESFKHGGKEMLSVRRQMKEIIERSKDEALRQLGDGIGE
jgi:hypothetical protein